MCAILSKLRCNMGCKSRPQSRRTTVLLPSAADRSREATIKIGHKANPAQFMILCSWVGKRFRGRRRARRPDEAKGSAVKQPRAPTPATSRPSPPACRGVLPTVAAATIYRPHTAVFSASSRYSARGTKFEVLRPTPPKSQAQASRKNTSKLNGVWRKLDFGCACCL